MQFIELTLFSLGTKIFINPRNIFALDKDEKYTTATRVYSSAYEEEYWCVQESIEEIRRLCGLVQE